MADPGETARQTSAARHQQIALKKLARSTPKTFRPAPSKPVIAPDQKRRIARAKLPRDGSNM